MCPLSFASLCKIPGSGGSAASGNDFQLYIIGSYRYAFEYVTALNCGVWACFGLVAVKGPGGLRTRTAVVYIPGARYVIRLVVCDHPVSSHGLLVRARSRITTITCYVCRVIIARHQ